MSKARLYRGDCLPFLKTLTDASCDAVVSDPPFLVDYKNDIYDDSSSQSGELVPSWYREWFRVLKDDSYVFLHVGIKNINMWIDCGIEAGFTFKNIIATRAFNNGSMVANNFAFVMQPILVFSKGGGRKFNKVDFFPTSEEWMKDKRNKDAKPFTYQYPNFIPTDITYGTEVFGGMSAANAKEKHPNAKNLRLIAFFIEIATNEGDTILDPFLGSGTTGVAALSTDRDFIGCEMNETWFKRSRNRIANANPLFGGEVVSVGLDTPKDPMV